MVFTVNSLITVIMGNDVVRYEQDRRVLKVIRISNTP